MAVEGKNLGKNQGQHECPLQPFAREETRPWHTASMGGNAFSAFSHRITHFLGVAQIGARKASRFYTRCDGLLKEDSNHASFTQHSAQFPDHAVVENDDKQDDLERPEMRPHDFGQ